jgi:hypothetical protein
MSQKRREFGLALCIFSGKIANGFQFGHNLFEPPTGQVGDAVVDSVVTSVSVL